MANRKSFLEEPVKLTLAPFVNFDFFGVSSWSEIELYAACVGAEVNINFLNALCAISYFFPNVRIALLDEIKTGSQLGDVANSTDFVSCIFKTFPAHRVEYAPVPSAEVFQWMKAETSGHVFSKIFTIPWPYLNQRTEIKYNFLSALDARFPYLLVKFYSQHAADLRRDDMTFVSWLVKRIEIRSKKDPVLIKVLDAIQKDARATDRTLMFMR